MNETEKAKNLLDDKITFAAVGEKGIYTSEKRGVAPILEKIDSDPEFFKGASVADRVIGKAAAMLGDKYGVSEIYAKVTSEHATAYLSDKKTVYEYTDISLEDLPENLQKEIQNGKYIETSESLYGFLENYSS